jgi:hypothetical protein
MGKRAMYKKPRLARIAVETVPESASVESLIDMVKEHLSPQAVATIIAYLQPARVKDKAVQREVEWFSEKLVEAVGGNAALNQLMDEVGL